MDTFSKSDPFIVVWMKDWKTGKYGMIDKTERIK
jgi:hypothetical protein